MMRILAHLVILVLRAFNVGTVGFGVRILPLGLLLAVGGHANCRAEVLRYHTLVLDGQNKIIPWSAPTTNAFDNYLVKCWSWALAAPNDTNGLPISFLYCAWNPGNPPTANTSWENDVGEKIPNWVESARLYYQYTGDMAPLNYVKRLVDYSLVHGQTPANHAWPDFPVGTANAGDTEFRGFTGVWSLWDCHVDLAADIGFSMYRMYQVYGDTKYRDKAIHVADVLAANIVAGTATDSPWPYVINSQTGENKSRYAASWDGALQLFDLLIQSNQGSVSNYGNARTTLKNWLLTYPMQNGNWVDGHSDVKINSTANWSTTCASDMCLYLLEHPDWDPNFMTDVPKLLKWIEDNFVNVSTPDGLTGQYHGAYVPAEQTAYMYRMGYQTSRLGAQYAQWYAVSGDEVYKDRAYRCLSYNTYMMQGNGQSSDGPTDTVGFWWSDCYGEATRMYYLALGAVPEWAPPGQNHLLRSSSVVTAISYSNNLINYTTFNEGSTETLRIAFVPASVLVNGVSLPQRADLSQAGWVFSASNGVLRIRHDTGTNVQVIPGASGNQPPTVALTSPADSTFFTAPATIPMAATATTAAGSIALVGFYNGATELGGATLAPYGFTWNNVPIGNYALTAVAGDTLGNIGTSAVVNVTVVGPLAQIGVTPSPVSVAPGGRQQFTAIGFYSGSSAQDITSQVTWTSSNTEVATINASGLATAVAAGTTTISAALSGVSGSTTLLVQVPPLAISTTSLANGVVNVGYSATLTASGGTLPYTWSMPSGSLPTGLTLNASSGAITGTPSVAGAFNFTVQVSDNSSPVQSAAKAFSFTVASLPSVVTIWPSTAVPARVDSGSRRATELGVKFRSDVAGTITGIRFYKAAANTGTHIGNLWTSAGTRLATATFSGESASGWQQVLFSVPVTIASNTVYVASYHVNNGHYSADAGYFSSKGADNAPLHALSNGVSGGNGVYLTGSNSAFPSRSANGTNQWVDVIFKPAAVATLMSIAVAPANQSIFNGATQQFTATGTYSDGSTQNLTAQATWASTSTAVATINAAGLATGVSTSATTISATLVGVTGQTTLTVQAPPTLASIAMTPANPTILVGATKQFTALGTYSDGSTQNLGSRVTWTSSKTAVATINANGLATAVSAGATDISAALSGVTAINTLTVQPVPLVMTTTSMPAGAVSAAYSATLSATGGTPPFIWSIASGSLPGGLTLNTATAVITGTPTTTGASSFTVRVTDAGTPAQTATGLLSITINSAGAPGLIGNTTEGTLTDTMWDGGAWINACRFQAASNMVVSSMRAKVAAIPGKYKCAIYSDVSSQPNRLLGSTAEVGNPASGWQSFLLTSSVALTKGSYYWLAIWSGDANARVYYSGNNGTLRWGRYNYGTWPDPISTTGGGSMNYCLYATQ